MRVLPTRYVAKMDNNFDNSSYEGSQKRIVFSKAETLMLNEIVPRCKELPPTRARYVAAGSSYHKPMNNHFWTFTGNQASRARATYLAALNSAYEAMSRDGVVLA